mgnify:CR=1 FL=1
MKLLSARETVENEELYVRPFTGAEWLLIALMDKNSTAITHGINCEYPILYDDDPFWIWMLEAHDNPNLEDN